MHERISGEDHKPCLAGYGSDFSIAVNLSTPSTAMKQYNPIAQGIESLSTFPERYPLMRSEAEHRNGIRQIIIDHYSAFYIVHGDEVTVIRVLYSASDISTRLQENF